MSIRNTYELFKIKDHDEQILPNLCQREKRLRALISAIILIVGDRMTDNEAEDINNLIDEVNAGDSG